MTGSIFDVEEFAVYDGPGMRTVIFLKGCPLRCRWCHNPEGLRPGPQRVTSHSMCIRCGACSSVCPSPDQCTGCGKCMDICPAEAVHIAGAPVEAQVVADKVLANAKLLAMNGGGVTFSGGEPLLQPDFVLELCSLLPDLHKCIETCGYAPAEVFDRVTGAMDYVIMDVKLVDSAAHKRWTGVDNDRILQNLQRLKQSGKPFRIRIPLIPDVNDSPENMRATAQLIAGAPALDQVELLPYHTAAGAKYQSAGLRYDPGFPTNKAPQIDTQPFEQLGMEVHVL